MLLLLFSGERGWTEKYVDLPSDVKHVVIEGYRGGLRVDEDHCDVAVDDLKIESGACPEGKIHVCTIKYCKSITYILHKHI